jgi:hypothetical protein
MGVDERDPARPSPDPVAAMVAVAREVMWPQPWQVPILEPLRERLRQVADQ